MSNLLFTESSWEEYLYIAATDKVALKKLNALLKEISRTPFTGTGSPEHLLGEKDLWSRRLNQKDRPVYKVEGDTIHIIECRSHYDDL